MNIFIIIKGLFIGFLASAPMGPVGMLCIQRTLTESRRHGLFTGLGAATGDMIFALVATIAALGLGVNTEFLHKHELLLTVFASVILIGFGIFVYRKNPSKNIKAFKETNPSFWKVYASSTFLTISNIFTLFFYMGLFAQFNMINANRLFIYDIFIILSVGVGGFLWWLLITYVVHKIRGKFNPRGLKVLNCIIGIILIVFGVAAVISLLTGIRFHF